MIISTVTILLRIMPMTNGELVRTQRNIETTTKNRGLTHALAVYVHDQITFWDLLIAPGIRMEYIKTEFTDHLTKSIAR